MMRLTNLARLTVCLGLFGILIVGAFAMVSAVSGQATATPVPTVNPAMSLMVKEAGSCPVGGAKEMLTNMQDNPEATQEAMSEAMTPEATAAATETVDTGVKCLVGEFSGSAEVPGPGEKDAAGVILVSVHGSSGNLCYEIAVANITLPATELHINKAGTMAVSLHPRPDKNGLASGCVAAGVKLVTAIENSPADYTVDVYTSDFPKGAAGAHLVPFDASMISTPEAASVTSAATEMMSSTESIMVTPEATAAG